MAMVHCIDYRLVLAADSPLRRGDVACRQGPATRLRLAQLLRASLGMKRAPVASWLLEPQRRALRLAVTVPSLLLICCVYLALFPLLVVGAAAVDIIGRRRWLAVRTVLVLALDLAVHTGGLLAMGGLWLVAGPWLGGDGRRFARWDMQLFVALARLSYAGAERLYQMSTVVQGADVLQSGGPVICLFRHASIVDTLLPLVILGGRYGIAPRYVMKRELLLDPCVDIFGRRHPAAFVRRGMRLHGPEIARVQRLAEDLGADDAVILFPEGTRFTPAKRRCLLDRLVQQGSPYAEQAQALRHVLPPHPGGVLGLLERCPEADVVFCTHTGFEGARELRDLFTGALYRSAVQIRFWRCAAAQIPKDRDGRIAWLYTWWARVDGWIDAHRRRAYGRPVVVREQPPVL